MEIFGISGGDVCRRKSEKVGQLLPTSIAERKGLCSTHDQRVEKYAVFLPTHFYDGKRGKSLILRRCSGERP